MPSQSALFVASVFAGIALVKGQAAPNWAYIPVACTNECSQTLQASYLCETQYSGDSTSIYGCFCNNYPSDAATCASCLTSNNAAALGQLLTSTQTECPQAVQSCFFPCSINTCAATDIACQCDAGYLESIYQCASCNTANGNTGATQISDFNALQSSCLAQNFTGAAEDFSAYNMPTANSAGYVAPTLTATGGGAAATGDPTKTDGALAAGGGGATAAGVAATITGAASQASAGSQSTKVVTVANVVTGTPTAGAASTNAIPAFGGLLALGSVLISLL